MVWQGDEEYEHEQEATPTLDAIGGRGKGKGKGKGKDGKGFDKCKGKGKDGKGKGAPWGVQTSSWIERPACHGCLEVGHILRDCPKASDGKGHAASLALEDASGPPDVTRGTFASFAVKRRPVVCATDSV